MGVPKENRYKPKCYIKAIQNLHENSTSRIHIGKKFSTEFLVTERLCHGYCIPPTLLKI
jgi:hypothetical protein